MEFIGTESGFCAQTAGLWQFAGYIIMAFKIILPLSLIISGIIILGKTVISSDEKENKKEYSRLVKCIITAVVTFFVPTIITTLFGVVNGFNEVRSDYDVCEKCMTHPQSEYCTNKVLASEYMNY